MTEQEATDSGTALATRLMGDDDLEAICNDACVVLLTMDISVFKAWTTALAHDGQKRTRAIGDEAHKTFSIRLGTLNVMLAKRSEFMTIMNAFNTHKRSLVTEENAMWAVHELHDALAEGQDLEVIIEAALEMKAHLATVPEVLSVFERTLRSLEHAFRMAHPDAWQALQARVLES